MQAALPRLQTSPLSFGSFILLLSCSLFGISSSFLYGEELPTLKYNHPGLVVDLHVGLWAFPIPCDFDQDGDHDLLVSCPDKPQNGTYFFENTQGKTAMPVFKAPVRLGPAYRDIMPSYKNGEMRLLTRNEEITDIKKDGFKQRRKIYPTTKVHTPREKYTVRGNQWRFVDYEGDGDDDLLIGIGDWEDYGMNFSGNGWAHAYDEQGRWKLGPLRGFVYVVRNNGTQEKPEYGEPERLTAGGEDVDVYGRPSPNLADFDGDGDLDLLCGEFLDGFTYYQNVGSRKKPKFAAGKRLMYRGEELKMDLEMIVPVAFDWDRDGDFDLIVGDEDGRVAFVEHTGKFDEEGTPLFEEPYYFQQEADDVYFGALVTPAVVDWDNDGDQDILTGNSAGYVALIENLDGNHPPKLAAPVKLKADLQTIRLQAGPNGSCQGPSEPKWGYTAISVADWDHDGLNDLIVNSIWGKVVWYQNIGTPEAPMLTSARPIEVEWPGNPPKPPAYWWEPQGSELATQWRTTPYVMDWNDDGLNDLVMLDHEGFLAFYEREKQGERLKLLPGKRVFQGTGPSVFNNRHQSIVEEAGPLQLNNGIAGRGGRVKLAFGDWDGDGHHDLLVNSINISWMKGYPGENGSYTFEEQGPLSDHVLAGHTTSPALWDWNQDGTVDLLIGAEDGRYYLLKNKTTSSR
ncbi:Repeat domain in Vibrio, Colwellia, Bradyrhizobium and Shewanella [Planctomycetales bacterium 10988]|nr:Repeat domain in Vibrio, Colwellia, Bradyrhizobium and Shewanella [Planctomycetales bacterium 10988]